MSRLEHVYKSLENLCAFLEPALPFLNAHLSNYFTDDLWTAHIPPGLKDHMDSISVEDMKNFVREIAKQDPHEEYYPHDFNSKIHLLNSTNVNDVVKSVKFRLTNKFRNSFSVVDLECHGIHVGKNEKGFKNFDIIMRDKKMHEVEKLSELVAATCNRQSIKHIVDIGSGKGYLSSLLAMLYEYQVLAIDSSHKNNEGSTKRIENLQKLWPHLIRRANERSLHGSVEPRGKKGRKVNQEFRFVDKTVKNEADLRKEDEEYYSENELKTTGMNLKSITAYVTEKTDLLGILAENGFFGDETIPSRFGLVGLHTCGNLGVESLKLFVSNEGAQFLCNVPCCFHLLSEKMSPSKTRPDLFMYDHEFWASDTHAIESINFPVSDFMKTLVNNTGFQLGRNARMVCSQTLQRMCATEEGLELVDTLLYRTILQIILKDRFGESKLEHNVGRLRNKVTDFNDYVRKSIKRLHAENKLKITDSEIEKVYQSVEAHKDNLHKYYLLRSMFAPLTELCILLDRLAYLLEQKCVAEAYLVDVFDPALSPRRTALLAIKNSTFF